MSRLLRWTAGRIVRFAPLVIVLLALTWGVDPAQDFESHRQDARVADDLLAGRAVRWGGVDARAVARLYIEREPAARDVVVIGSSHGSFIRAEQFPGRTFFNISLGGAQLEDVVALYGMYRRAGHLPRLLVVSAEPWMLNRNAGLEYWRGLRAEYEAGLRLLGREPTIASARVPNSISRIARLIDLRYVQGAVWQFLSRASIEDVPFARETRASETVVRRPDGSFVSPPRVLLRDVDVVRAEAIALTSEGWVIGVESFDHLYDERRALLEALVERMQRDGVSISFFLTPYHPALWSVIQRYRRYRVVQDVEAYFLALAEHRGMEIFGSYDPAVCRIGEEDFIDGFHLKEDAVVRLFETCRRRAAQRQ